MCICIQLHLPISSQSGSSYQCNIFSLGQLHGFGGCSKQWYKIPNYTSHFKTVRKAGKSAEALQGDPPTVYLEYKSLSSTNTGSTSLYLPSNSSSPYMSSQAAIGGLYWIFLLFLCLVASGIYIDFSQPQRPYDRKHPSV